ncbi:MAG TPA: DUF5666 domain-containing protein, partial [Phototrophicaceae bacterium]|nr:DUF5666 domain-containing protein [Phototrophicaceae bacterium]
MSTTAMRKWFIAITVALIVAMLPVAVHGQGASVTTGSGQKVSMVGTLESVGDGFVVVSGQKIETAGATIGTNLVVGATVEVTFDTTADGILIAVSVAYPEVEDLHFTGTVESIGDGTMTVSGLPFDTTDATVEDGVEVGSVVDVQFTLVDGQAVASEVSLAGDNTGDDPSGDDN